MWVLHHIKLSFVDDDTKITVLSSVKEKSSSFNKMTLVLRTL